MPSVRIELNRGSILETRADVCVSTVHRSKDLRAFRLSHKVLKACGEKVQDELLSKGTLGQEMENGEVEQTSAGNLTQFKCILFLCLYKWQEGNEKILLQAIIECLELVSVLGHRTIAFPALGMGGQQYPAHQVATCLTQAVALYNLQYSQVDSTLETVYIVLMDQQTEAIKSFLQICSYGTTDASQFTDSAKGRGVQKEAKPSPASMHHQFYAQNSQSSPNIRGQSSTTSQGQSSTTSHGQAASGSSSALGSMLTGLIGLVSNVFSLSYSQRVGPLHYRVKTAVNKKSIGAQLNLSVDISFLESFIPSTLKSFLASLQ